MNKKAIFSDETKDYKTPYEPKSGDTVTIKIRALKNDIIQAYAYINGKKTALKRTKTEGEFDFFEASFICGDKKVEYYFELLDEDDKIYYNRLGCLKKIEKEYNFSFTPNFTIPDWAKGAIYYQIFTDRFCNGDKTNDVEDNEYFYTGGHSVQVKNWEKVPDELDVRCFYGGDLQGVRKKLSYLKDLGVEVIYFNPLFVSPSNHKYDTQDYEYIDPHLAIIKNDLEHKMEEWEHHNGYAPKYIKRVTDKENLEKSNEFFAQLVKEIHGLGMKVVIDGVFNHCGSFNKWLDREGIYLSKKGYEKGAFQCVKSPYRSYFKFKNPDIVDSEYEGWWNYITLPKLNYEESEELEQSVLRVGAKWVSAPYCADGWRLDVAADLGHSEKYNHEFWKKFRRSVRDANPQAFIMSEHYGSPKSWLEGDEWDSVMNYDAFMEPVTWFLTGVDKHSKSFSSERFLNGELFFESMAKNMAKFPRPSLDSALNQLSNHDHSRFLTRTNGTVGTIKTMGAEAAKKNIDKAVFALGVLLQMTWPGSPGIYYGDEAGQVGWTDPDNRRTYPWGKEDKRLILLHKKLTELRGKTDCLKMGSVKALTYGDGYISYARFNKNDCVIVVINRNKTDEKFILPVWEAGVKNGAVLSNCFDSSAPEFNCEEQVKVKNGRVTVEVKAKSGKAFYCKL
ncbi:MAG: glycoside hydrolase family 13 protein [Clostridiales bacterium]|nr:glycoside hydrolase family 13 protein [Clostridiales bacterium]